MLCDFYIELTRPIPIKYTIYDPELNININHSKLRYFTIYIKKNLSPSFVLYAPNTLPPAWHEILVWIRYHPISSCNQTLQDVPHQNLISSRNSIGVGLQEAFAYTLKVSHKCQRI